MIEDEELSSLLERDSSSSLGTFLRAVAEVSEPGSTLIEPFTDHAPEVIDLGSDRFVLLRRLGAGGFGTVYEARDLEHDAVVALKVLRRQDGRALYGFKREFRALTELGHPNLVQLYELHGAAARWFFTMELIEGQSAATYVRPAPGATFDLPRLRLLLQQLAEGLCFLHEEGRLHRDIKPSNVMVTPDDRVVLLDFGLVVDLAEEDASDEAIAGTPRYMAPEQAGGAPVGPAADWYAVGVMLYEALAGAPLFPGAATQILRLKRTVDPPELPAAGLPEDLRGLCIDLLQRSPARRPDGREVLARLARPSLRFHPWAGEGRSDATPTLRREPALVGRAAHRSALHAAFESARAGSAVVALVHGRSGMGKSALVGRFLEELRERAPSAVVLTGRCFEQESVPYKALDSLVDALSQHLGRLPLEQARALLPPDVHTLSRLFPVLQQVRAVKDAPQRAGSADRFELRRRAFTALRALLARLGALAPLALFIDDLQWGDADSGALLADLLAPPDPPALLLIAAYRTDEAEQSECLRALLPALQRAADSGLDRREIPVERLPFAEARALALATLPDGGATAERAEEIARESDGWPFLIAELSRFAGGLDDALGARGRAAGPGSPERSPGGGPEPRRRLSLDAMLRARVDALPADARRLLEVIAVAGQPVLRSVAARAAEVGGEAPGLVGKLRRLRLVRVRSGPEQEELETYHDRIREAVESFLTPEEKQAHHTRLAPALLATGRADPETLAVHFQAAGDAEQAFVHAVHAADQAMEALGFDRATRLYQQALGLLPDQDLRRILLHEKLASALSSAGRSVEAAENYLLAARGAAPTAALELRRVAAENYLISGRVDEGLRVMEAVLKKARITLPGTPLGAALRTLPLLARLKLSGMRFRERPASAIPAEERLRLDACTAVAAGLAHHDPMRSVYVQKLSLLLALRAGDPRRLFHALTYELGYSGTRGVAGLLADEGELLGVMRPLAERFPDLAYRNEVCLGLNAAFHFRHREALARLEKAEATFTGQEAGTYLEQSFARYFLIQALFWLGSWKELARRQRRFLDDAQTRGNVYLESILSANTGWVPSLAAGRIEEARAAARRAEELWPRASQFQHLYRLVSRYTTELYAERGAGPRALDLVLAQWPAIQRSGLLSYSGGIQLECVHMRASARLAAAASASPGRRHELLRAAERDAAEVERSDSPLRAFMGAVRGSIAAARGDREQALARLLRAEATFARYDFLMLVQATRRRRGELLRGDEGAQLIAEADAAMGAEGIVDPARMTSALLPGIWA